MRRNAAMGDYHELYLSSHHWPQPLMLALLAVYQAIERAVRADAIDGAKMARRHAAEAPAALRVAGVTQTLGQTPPSRAAR